MNTIEIVLKMPEIVWSWKGLWNSYADIAGFGFILFVISYLAAVNFMQKRSRFILEIFLSLPSLILIKSLLRPLDMIMIDEEYFEKHKKKADQLDRIYGDDLE